MSGGVIIIATAQALERAAAIVVAQAAKGSNGYANRLNIYVCEACAGHIITRDMEAGVTPAFMNCKCTMDCKGQMVSSFYRVSDQSMREDYQWRRPQPTEALTPWELDHVSMGGLLLRPRPDAPFTAEMLRDRNTGELLNGEKGPRR